MDHWNKGGLSREEFLHMREDAMRKLQELAKKQAPGPQKAAAPSTIQTDGTQPALSIRKEALDPPQSTANAYPSAKSKNVEEKNLSDSSPARTGGEEHPPFSQEAFISELAPSEEIPHRAESHAEHMPEQGQTEEKDADDVSASFAESAEPLGNDERSDGFMPSESLLQTIQDISDTMADAAFFPEELPDTVPLTEKQAPPAPVPDPPPAQAIPAEPVFVPPLPYHPDGFIPGKAGRGPSFHPDAVRPEKGYYHPPRPPKKPHQPENHWKEENSKKK